MLLSLIPPISYPIPELLQTHLIPLPASSKTKFHARVPAFSRVNRSLDLLGITLPTFLAADKANWFSFAVEEVKWNLETDEIEVEFVDGSKEKWDIEEPINDELVEKNKSYPSEEFIQDDSSPQNGFNWEKSMLHQLEEKIKANNKVKKEVKGKIKSESTLDRLISISRELRSAFEDVNTLEEEDYTTLMELSANPSLTLPLKWNLDIASRSPEEESDSNSSNLTFARLQALQEEENKRSKSAASLASPPTSENSTIDENLPGKSSGQLTNRKRPIILPSSSLINSSDQHTSHDILSFIHLITTTRETLVNLFSSTIIPILKKRLPPTYSLWAASNSILSLRKKAIKRGAKVAKLMLDLLDDDGETYDVSEDESIGEDDLETYSDNSEDEDRKLVEAGLIWWNSSGKKRETLEEKKERRLKKNFLSDVFDDLSLKVWCERALVRGEELKEDIQSGGEPNWTGKLQNWDVSRSIPPSFLKSRVSGIKKKSTTTTSRDETEEILDSILSNSPKSNKFNEKYNYSSDEETDKDEPYHVDSSIYFYPQNIMHEDLLPPRLPKTLLVKNETLELGKELSSMKQLIKSILDGIAGIQKKMIEVSNFIELGYLEWEELKHEHDVVDSQISSPKITGKALKATANDGTVLLSMQPLRHITADTALASNLKQSLHKVSSETLATLTSTPMIKSHLSISSIIPPSLPRRRQKANLAALDVVLGNKRRTVQQSTPAVPIIGKKRKRSKEVVAKNSTVLVSEPGKKKEKKSVDEVSSPLSSELCSDDSDTDSPLMQLLLLQTTHLESLSSSPPLLLVPATPAPIEQKVLRLSPQELSTQRRGLDESINTTMDWKSFEEKDYDIESGDLLVIPSIEESSRLKFWKEEEEEQQEEEEESNEEWKKLIKEDFIGLSRKFSSSPTSSLMEDIQELEIEGDTTLQEKFTDESNYNFNMNHSIELAEFLSRAPSSFPKSFNQVSTQPIDYSLPSITTFPTPIISQDNSIITHTSDPKAYSLSINPIILSPIPFRPSLNSAGVMDVVDEEDHNEKEIMKL